MALDQRVRELAVTAGDRKPVELEQLARPACLAQALALVGERRRPLVKLLRSCLHDRESKLHLIPFVMAESAAPLPLFTPVSFSASADESEIREIHRLPPR
jgi:hypothetical protein